VSRGAVVLALLALLAGACERRHAPPAGDNATRERAAPAAAGDVVAVINGEPLTGADLDLFARRIVPDFAGKSRAEWNAAIDMLINNRLLARKAEAEGLDRVPRVKAKVDAATNGLWETPYWNAVVRPTVALTEEDFRKKAPRFQGSLTVRQMVVSDPDLAESLRRAVLADRASFERLVKEKSEGLTAEHGGIVSHITKDSPQYSREILDRLFASAKGDITPVMKSPIGYTFFEVLDKETPEEMERRWRREAAPELLKEKALSVWEKHLDRLAARSRIRVHEKTVRAYLEARRQGKDLTGFANRPAFTIDNVTYYLGELVDPSGIGVVHGAPSLETIVNKRVKQHLVAREVERTGLRAKFPGIALEERYVRENVLARAYIDHRARGLSVSEAEMRQYYRENRSKFLRPRTYEISAIETRSPDRLRRIYEALAAGRAFGDVAQEWSDNRDRQPRGKVGRIREDRLSKEFAPAVKSLAVGEYTKRPVELPLGGGKTLYVVLRLDAAAEPGYIPYERVPKDDIRKAVLARKREAVVKTVMEELRRENRVEITPAYYRFADGQAARNSRAGGGGGHGS